MKKIIIFLCSLLILVGCSSDKVTEITAALLLPQEQLAPYLEYTPSFSEKTTRRCSVAEYRADPLGSGDPVIIKIYQPNQLLSNDAVLNSFNESREFRNDAFSIDSLGVECYVAYPSIHYYANNCHVEITAGSGSDNDQKILLMNLAKISLDNFNKYKDVLSTEE